MATIAARGAREKTAHFQMLRSTLARFATGVAIVTTTEPDGHPVGMTVNSFASVSLDPPLILWCLRRAARSVLAFTRADCFAVNILGADQQPLAQRFASGPRDRFADIPWRRHRHGPPLVAGAIASFVCRRTDLLDGGDHLIVIGRVDEYDAYPGTPLLFLDGDYREPAEQPEPLVVAEQSLVS